MHKITQNVLDPDELYERLSKKLDHRLEMFEFQTTHQIEWGVPYGPTEAMVVQEEPPTTFERYLRGNV
jgi:hypothetical protein